MKLLPNILLLVIVLYCLLIDAKRLKSPRTGRKLQQTVADDEESCLIPLIEEPAPVEIPVQTTENIAVDKEEEEEEEGEKPLRTKDRSQSRQEAKKLASRTKKSKRNSKKHHKRARKVSWHQVLRTFFVSLFDPTCGGRIDLDETDSSGSGSSTGIPSRHEVTPGIVPMATYGPVCGPNGCF
eukprot:scaffold421_cov176-Ochromonas_danica.AAC.1